MYQNKTLQGYLLLLTTALLWGTAFIFQKNSAGVVDAFTFNTLRFATAIPALLVLKLLPKKLFEPDIDEHADNNLEAAEPSAKDWTRSATAVGIGAGVFMFLGISLQQFGLAYTTAGKSGFLTSIYIVIVPILGLLFKEKPQIEVWVGALLCLGGIYLLGGGGNSDLESQFNRGDALTLLCAIAWAAQVLWLGAFAKHSNVLTIALVQMAVVALLSAVAMFIGTLTGLTELPRLETISELRVDIAYTGIISAAVAFTLQILGQRHVSATSAALVMSTESVFALFAGMIFLEETVTLAAALGSGLILTGIIIAQTQGKLQRFFGQVFGS